MSRITRTEAADIVAGHVRKAHRAHGRPIDLTMCEEVVSEFRGGHRGGWLAGVAKLANPKTVLRIALREAKAQGEI